MSHLQSIAIIYLSWRFLGKSPICGLACLPNHVWLFVTPQTVACQAPLSLGFPRQEYWSGLLFPPPEHLPNQGLNPSLLCLLHCRQILYPWATREAPLLIFGLTQSSLCKKSSIPENLTRTISCNNSWENQESGQKCKRNIWVLRYPHGGSKKLWIISGGQEACVRVQGCAHAKGRPEKVLIIQVRLTLRFSTSRK